MSTSIDYYFMEMPMQNAMDSFPSLHQLTIHQDKHEASTFIPLDHFTKSPAPVRGIFALGEGLESGDEETPFMTPAPNHQDPFTPLDHFIKSPAPVRGILTLGEGPESGDEETTPLMTSGPRKSYSAIEEAAPAPQEDSVSVTITPPGNGEGERVVVSRQISNISSGR
jgi:hypothetical protein